MDPELLKQHKAFKQRAVAQPVVETKPGKQPKKKLKADNGITSKRSVPASLSYKAMAGSSQFKFSILAKIINYMKKRHQDSETHTLSVEEILDETRQTDVGTKIRIWLETEALQKNPKIKVIDGNRFVFKPPYDIKNKKDLLRLLDRQDQRGLGGIFREDIEESLPDADKCIKALKDKDRIILVNRPDKRTVLFYNDNSYQFTVDEEFCKMWRNSAVDGMDEGKIADYLQKNGISTMSDVGIRRKVMIPKRKGGGNRRRQVNMQHNQHLADVLQDYSHLQSKNK